jgi:cyclohexanecarboxyl-CoA dehydrogenase
MCKWWAPKLAADVIHHSMLVHGWLGYTDDVPQEQRLRDVIALETGDGSGEVMKMIIVREMMGRDYLPY